MNKQSGVSSLLAVAASLLVAGLVAAGSPASAANEEDLAAPQGSFVSTMPVPAIERVAYAARNQAAPQPSAGVVYSEEDLAAPPGSFVSTMAVPGNDIRVAAAPPSENDAVDYDELSRATLDQIVADSL